MGFVPRQSLPTALQDGEMMGQGKILCLQGQVGWEAERQGRKPDENGRFHGAARLPAEAANRNDFNAVGIIGIQDPEAVARARRSTVRCRFGRGERQSSEAKRVKQSPTKR
jgi:hypothetical protein